MDADSLIAFEEEVARRFEQKRVPGPIHLFGGGERQLCEIFKEIRPSDWVFCSYRQHMHALLHGIPEALVMAEIMAGRSMTMSFPEHRFYSTAIVGGQCSIATGAAWVATHEAHVWCFVGDMAAAGGAFHEATQYALSRSLPLTFVVEDNGYSCDTPTNFCWSTGPYGYEPPSLIRRYRYERTRPHTGIGRHVQF